MKRLSTFAAIAVFACTAAVNAQTTSSDTGARRTAPSPQTSQSGSTATPDQGTTTPRATTATRPRAQRARTAPPAAQTAEQITVAGCLQANQASASAAPAAGTRAARRAQANQIPTFMLNNASQQSGTAEAAANTSPNAGSQPSSTTASSGRTPGRSVGTSGTTGAAHAPATATQNPTSQISNGSGSYLLQGLDLTSQVGQQVEVTGVIIPPSNTRRRNASASQAASDANASMQRIRVTSARMIAPNCGNQ